MSVEAIMTITKMIELFPDNYQEKVVEHLRDYISDLEDDIKWEIKFKNTQSKLTNIAQKVRNQITEGKTKEFDFEKL
jgi:hypothetical protein